METLSPTVASSTSGNAQAPASTQHAASTTSATQPAAATPATAQPSLPTPDDLVKSVGFEQTLEEKYQIAERQRAASSTEAKRLNAALENLRKEQGVKPVFDKNGAIKGWEAEEGFEHKAPEVKLPKYSELSAKDKERYQDDPEGFIEDFNSRVAERLNKSFVRAKPTVEAASKIEDLSDSDRTAALDYVGQSKLPDGTDKYDNYESHIRPTVDRLMRDPTLPEAVRNAIAKAPAVMAQLFSDRVANSMASWSKRGQNAEAAKNTKQDAAARAAEQLPGGVGQVQIGQTKTAGQLHAERMAGSAWSPRTA